MPASYILYRLSLIPRTSDLAEVLTNTIALGWAWAFWWPDTFGPPGTTVAHIVETFGSGPAATWALTAAVLPILSIAWGGHAVRFVSTMICGSLWSMLILVSASKGLWLSPAMMTATACLVALFASQCLILSRWPGR